MNIKNRNDQTEGATRKRERGREEDVEGTRMTVESGVVDTCMEMRKEIRCKTYTGRQKEKRKCLFLPVVGTEKRGT